MYYCEECRQNKNWPKSLATSLGNCEICGEKHLCYDRQASTLPAPVHLLEEELTKEDLAVEIAETRTQLASINDEIEALLTEVSNKQKDYRKVSAYLLELSEKYYS